MRGKSHDEFMIEHLKENPAFAVELLNIAIEENTPAELAIVIRQIRAAGLKVSSVVSTPKPRKRAKAVTAKTMKRPSTRRVRTRRSAAVASA